MEFLGTWLAPTNSISEGSDRLTKVFYFRPDKYDDPTQDLENILKVKADVNFPQRLDRLAEASGYVIDSIEVSKKLSDDELGIERVSFIVTAEYELEENLKDDSSSSSETEEDSGGYDEDDNKITRDTPPWKQKASFNYQYIERTVPLLSGFSGNTQNVAIVNTAGDYIETTTEKYLLEINYSKNYQAAQYNWDVLQEPWTNADTVQWTSILPDKSFPSGTLLILPPQCSRELYETEETKNGVTSKVVKPYFRYSVKFLYNADGWNKKLLNIGTRAKFSGQKAEQIYSLTLTNENGMPLEGYPKYVCLSDVVAAQKAAAENNQIVGYEAITQPLPLDENGKVDTVALQETSSTGIHYRTKEFKIYKSTSFSVFPIVK